MEKKQAFATTEIADTTATFPVNSLPYDSTNIPTSETKNATFSEKTPTSVASEKGSLSPHLLTNLTYPTYYRDSITGFGLIMLLTDDILKLNISLVTIMFLFTFLNSATIIFLPGIKREKTHVLLNVFTIFGLLSILPWTEGMSWLEVVYEIMLFGYWIALTLSIINLTLSIVLMRRNRRLQS